LGDEVVARVFKNQKRFNKAVAAMRSPRRRIRTEPTVCILESLRFFEEVGYSEGEIIARTLRLSEKEVHHTTIRSRDELDAFAKQFRKTPHRYLHISCHGSKDGFWLTTGKLIPGKDFAQILGPHLEKRRVFLSACLAAESDFAFELLSNSKCRSVVAPVGEIKFDDAAVFWIAF
jgi:hypothetical protein